MPKKELTQEEQIIEAVKDVQDAMIANITANKKLIEINREKTTTKFTLREAETRLANLKAELMEL